MTSREPVDVLVVGAGVVGLAHAVHAVERGARVAVVERDPRARGASVRNFGHGCVTGQAGDALRYATAARRDWLRLARAAGFWLRDRGTVVVARADDERAGPKNATTCSSARPGGSSAGRRPASGHGGVACTPPPRTPSSSTLRSTTRTCASCR